MVCPAVIASRYKLEQVQPRGFFQRVATLLRVWRQRGRRWWRVRVAAILMMSRRRSTGQPDVDGDVLSAIVDFLNSGQDRTQLDIIQEVKKYDRTL